MLTEQMTKDDPFFQRNRHKINKAIQRNVDRLTDGVETEVSLKILAEDIQRIVDEDTENEK